MDFLLHMLWPAIGRHSTVWQAQIADDIEERHEAEKLEKENSNLKKLVADISLDNAILKEAAQGNS